MTLLDKTLDNQKLHQLIDLAEMLSQQNNFQEILRLVAHKTLDFIGAEMALIMMLNPRTQQTVKTIIKEGLEDRHPHYRSVQQQISGWLMKHKQPLLTANFMSDPRFRNVILNDLVIKSVVGVPLQVEGVIIGSLILLNKKQQDEFTECDVTFLSKIAIIAAPYLRNVQKIQEFFETPLPEQAVLCKYEQVGLLGKSQRFIELLQAIEAAARCDVRVLLQGQSGTGKELIAKAIHKFSARSDKPFVAIDCGAIPGHLLESELFGYVKGAFTGATTDRKGLLQEADQGTLFMDEITNLPLEMQAKLMRVLQEGEVRPLGTNKVNKINVRIISASGSAIKDLVVEKKFREDLYYRIHVYPIHIPSLNDRQEDIPLLANHFLRKFAALQRKQAQSIHEEIMEFMKERTWDGNIRELENFVERLVTLATERMTVLKRDVLPEDLRNEMKNLKYVYDDEHVPKSLFESLAEYEEKLIRQVLIKHNWNQSRAARALKIPVQTIRYKMNKLGIEKPTES
ncbi:MAG: sigma-54 interaction domain-containing protein [bacterium]